MPLTVVLCGMTFVVFTPGAALALQNQLAKRGQKPRQQRGREEKR